MFGIKLTNQIRVTETRPTPTTTIPTAPTIILNNIPIQPPIFLPTKPKDSLLLSPKISSFNCYFCHSTLSKTIPKTKPLPSDYWLELLDCYYCHDEQINIKHSFHPVAGCLYVAGSYLLAHRLDLVGINDDGDCRHCESVIGTFDNSDQDSFKVQRYNVITSSSTTNTKTHIPFVSSFVNDVQELASAHATYRLILYEEGKDVPSLLFWILNSNIQVFGTTSPLTTPSPNVKHEHQDWLTELFSGVKESSTQKAINVLFLDIIDHQNSLVDDFDEGKKKLVVVGKWIAEGNSTEKIYLAKKNLEMLRLALNVSNLFLCPENRRLREFQCAFLPIN